MNIFRATIEGKNILDRSEKTQIVFVFFLGFVLSLVDILFIALTYPVISIISNNQNTNSAAHKLFQFFGVDSNNGRIAFAFTVVSVAYLMRTVVFITHKYLLARVRKNLFVRVSKRLYGSYIAKDVQFFQSNNTSQLIRNIYGVSIYLNNYVFGIINFASELLLGIGLVVILFLQSVVSTTVVVAVCLVGTFMIHKLTRRMMFRAGQQVSEFTAKRLEILQNGFDGIAEIKIYNQQQTFEKLYARFHNETAEAERKFEFYSVITSPVFELLIIFSMSVSMVLYLLLGSNPETIVPLLAVYVAVAFRFIPSFGRVIGFFQQFEFGRAMAIEIRADLESQRINTERRENIVQNTSSSIFMEPEDICLNNLTFSYGGSEKNVFEDVNYVFEANKIHGLMGTSGSGKSTLAKLLVGLLTPSVGGVLVGERSIFDNLDEWHSKIGYVPQQVFMMDSTLKQNIMFGRNTSTHDNEEITESLKSAGLHSFVSENDEGLDYQIGERGNRLSGGQKQRVGIARALYRKPDLLILDEATAGLDTPTEMAILETIRGINNPLTVIVISHSREVMKFCDTVNVINDGKLYKASQ